VSNVWIKRNWHWLAGIAAFGALAYVVKRRQSSLFGETPSEILRPIKRGPKGEIVAYVGPTGRCHACDFLDKTPRTLRNGFKREFDRAVQHGPGYWSPSFRPLATGTLWKVKAFDHRLYGIPKPKKDWLRFVLLRGWVKDKTRGVEELRQVAAARNVLEELERRQSE